MKKILTTMLNSIKDISILESSFFCFSRWVSQPQNSKKSPSFNTSKQIITQGSPQNRPKEQKGWNGFVFIAKSDTNLPKTFYLLLSFVHPHGLNFLTGEK